MPETSASITPSPVGPPENPEEPSQDPSPEQGGTPLPEGLGEGAEKFKTVEDLLKSYRELETKLSGGAPDPQPGGDPEPDQDPGPSTEELFSRAQQELLESGEFTQETRQELLARGIPESTLDFQIQAVKGLGQLYTHQIISEVGGSEEYARMQAWANRAMGEEDLKAFTDAVNSGDASKAIPYVRGMYAQYKNATTDPGHQVDGSVTSGGPEPFRSKEQMYAAMEDPRYGLANDAKLDPAYRQSVIDRIAASKF